MRRNGKILTEKNQTVQVKRKFAKKRKEKKRKEKRLKRKNRQKVIQLNSAITDLKIRINKFHLILLDFHYCQCRKKRNNLKRIKSITHSVSLGFSTARFICIEF